MTTYPARLLTAYANSWDWTSVNPVLMRGEIGYEEDTNKFKVGNGYTLWVDLPYADPAGSSAVDNAWQWATKMDGLVDEGTPYADYSAKYYAAQIAQMKIDIQNQWAAWNAQLIATQATMAIWMNFWKSQGTAPNQEMLLFSGNPALADSARPRYRFAADGKIYFKPVGGAEYATILDNGVDRKTAALWTSGNAVLPLNRFGIETDTLKMKIGDGVLTWNALPYLSAAIAGGEIDGGSASTPGLVP